MIERLKPTYIFTQARELGKSALFGAGNRLGELVDSAMDCFGDVDEEAKVKSELYKEMTDE